VEKYEYRLVSQEVRQGDVSKFQEKIDREAKFGFRVVNTGFDKYLFWAMMERAA
jgi:hypothetical protein